MSPPILTSLLLTLFSLTLAYYAGTADGIRVAIALVVATGCMFVAMAIVGSDAYGDGVEDGRGEREGE